MATEAKVADNLRQWVAYEGCDDYEADDAPCDKCIPCLASLLLASHSDLLEALRLTVTELEQIAANRAYKAGLGASEWESFVYDPERLALDKAYAAIRKAEGSA